MYKGFLYDVSLACRQITVVALSPVNTSNNVDFVAFDNVALILLTV